MAGITLEEAEAQLAAYKAAELKALSSQAYEISGRKNQRANLKEIREGLAYWHGMVRELSASSNGRGRSVTLAPRW